MFAAVVGEKLIARDLTIKNTAGPGKHQAVAVRVNSNAAFYHCNITSYQDSGHPLCSISLTILSGMYNPRTN